MNKRLKSLETQSQPVVRMHMNVLRSTRNPQTSPLQSECRHTVTNRGTRRGVAVEAEVCYLQMALCQLAVSAVRNARCRDDCDSDNDAQQYEGDRCPRIWFEHCDLLLLATGTPVVNNVSGEEEVADSVERDFEGGRVSRHDDSWRVTRVASTTQAPREAERSTSAPADVGLNETSYGKHSVARVGQLGYSVFQLDAFLKDAISCAVNPLRSTG